MDFKFVQDILIFSSFCNKITTYDENNFDTIFYFIV